MTDNIPVQDKAFHLFSFAAKPAYSPLWKIHHSKMLNRPFTSIIGSLYNSKEHI